MDAPVRPGDILAGNYRVDRVLGVGGMGVVVAATQLDLDRKVAMKFMLDEAFENVEARSRFMREARAVVKLRSEHVTEVFQIGALESGAPYIVMEYLEGTDLSDVLRTHGAMPLGLAAECIIQACDALAEAHSQGIVHRDLKPANLFLTQRSDGAPLIKVLDFGISKVSALTDQSMAMTKTSALMGSPLYMSPEQMRSAKDVDQRSDVWSLGIVLYEMLAGKVPFASQSLGELLYTVMTLPHPALSATTNRQDIPPDVATLIDWCLQKDPAARAPNVAEVARALAPYCPARSMGTVERISAVMHVVPAAGFQGAITTSGVRASMPGPLGFSASQPPAMAASQPQARAMGTSSQPGVPYGSQPGTSMPGTSMPGTSMPGTSMPGPPHGQTAAGWSGTSPNPAHSSSIARLIGVVAAVVLVTGALIVVRAVLGNGSSGAHAPAASAAVETSTPPAAATAPTPSATTAASASAAPESAAPATAQETPETSAQPPVQPAARPAAAAAHGHTAAPAGKPPTPRANPPGNPAPPKPVGGEVPDSTR